MKIENEISGYLWDVYFFFLYDSMELGEGK